MESGPTYLGTSNVLIRPHPARHFPLQHSEWESIDSFFVPDGARARVVESCRVAIDIANQHRLCPSRMCISSLGKR